MYECSKSRPVIVDLEILEEEIEDQVQVEEQPTLEEQLHSIMRREYIITNGVQDDSRRVDVIKHKATMRGELLCTFSLPMFTPNINDVIGDLSERNTRQLDVDMTQFESFGQAKE